MADISDGCGPIELCVMPNSVSVTVRCVYVQWCVVVTRPWVTLAVCVCVCVCACGCTRAHVCVCVCASCPHRGLRCLFISNGAHFLGSILHNIWDAFLQTVQLLAFFNLIITQVSIMCVWQLWQVMEVMAVTARYGSYGTLWQSGSLWQLRHFMTVVARYGSHETLWKIWHVMAVVAHYGTLWQLWHDMARYDSCGTLWQSWHVMTVMACYGS